MATIKSFTDLEQSKVLINIISLESADMYYGYGKNKPEFLPVSDVDVKWLSLPCWSLATLLGVLPNENMLVKTTDGEYYCLAKDVMTKHYDNPVDACYELILKLHELNLL